MANSNEQQGNSILSPVSHGQSVDSSQPSIFTPVVDPFRKLAAPLVQQPLREK